MQSVQQLLRVYVLAFLLVLFSHTIVATPFSTSTSNDLYFEIYDQTTDQFQIELTGEMTRNQTISFNIDLVIDIAKMEYRSDFSIALMDEMSCSNFSLKTINRDTHGILCSEDYYQLNNVCILPFGTGILQLRLTTTITCLSHRCRGKLYLSATHFKQVFYKVPDTTIRMRTPAARIFVPWKKWVTNPQTDESVHLKFNSNFFRLIPLPQSTYQYDCFTYDQYRHVISFSLKCLSNEQQATDFYVLVLISQEFNNLYISRLSSYFVVPAYTSKTNQFKQYMTISSSTAHYCTLRMQEQQVNLQFQNEYYFNSNIYAITTARITCTKNSLFLQDQYDQRAKLVFVLAPTSNNPAFKDILTTNNGFSSNECFLLHGSENAIIYQVVMSNNLQMYDIMEKIKKFVRTTEQLEEVQGVKLVKQVLVPGQEYCFMSETSLYSKESQVQFFAIFYEGRDAVVECYLNPFELFQTRSANKVLSYAGNVELNPSQLKMSIPLEEAKFAKFFVSLDVGIQENSIVVNTQRKGSQDWMSNSISAGECILLDVSNVESLNVAYLDESMINSQVFQFSRVEVFLVHEQDVRSSSEFKSLLLIEHEINHSYQTKMLKEVRPKLLISFYKIKLMSEMLIKFSSEGTTQSYEIVLLVPRDREKKIWIPIGKTNEMKQIILGKNAMELIKEAGEVVLLNDENCVLSIKLHQPFHELNRFVFPYIRFNSLVVDYRQLVIWNANSKTYTEDKPFPKLNVFRIDDYFTSNTSNFYYLDQERNSSQILANGNLKLTICCASLGSILIVSFGYPFVRSGFSNIIENKMKELSLYKSWFVCPEYKFEKNELLAEELFFLRINDEDELKELNDKTEEEQRALKGLQYKRGGRKLLMNESKCLLLITFDLIEPKKLQNLSIDGLDQENPNPQTIIIKNFFNSLQLVMSAKFMLTIEQSDENWLNYIFQESRQSIVYLQKQQFIIVEKHLLIQSGYLQPIYWEAAMTFTRITQDKLTIGMSKQHVSSEFLHMFFFHIDSRFNFTMNVNMNDDLKQPASLPLSYWLTVYQVQNQYQVVTKPTEDILNPSHMKQVSVVEITQPYSKEQCLIVAIPPQIRDTSNNGDERFDNAIFTMNYNTNLQFIPEYGEIMQVSHFTSNIFEQSADNTARFLRVESGIWRIYLLPCESSLYFYDTQKANYLIQSHQNYIAKNSILFIAPSMQITSQQFHSFSSKKRVDNNAPKLCLWAEAFLSQNGAGRIVIEERNDIIEDPIVRHEVSKVQFSNNEVDNYIFRQISDLVDLENISLVILFDYLSQQNSTESNDSQIIVRYLSPDNKSYSHKIATSKVLSQFQLRGSEFIEIYGQVLSVNSFNYFITDRSNVKLLLDNSNKIVGYKDQEFFLRRMHRDQLIYITISGLLSDFTASTSANLIVQVVEKVFIIGDHGAASVTVVHSSDGSVFGYLIATSLEIYEITVHVQKTDSLYQTIAVPNSPKATQNKWKLEDNTQIAIQVYRNDQVNNQLPSIETTIAKKQTYVLILNKNMKGVFRVSSQELLPKEMGHAMLVNGRIEQSDDGTDIILPKTVLSVREWNMLVLDSSDGSTLRDGLGQSKYMQLMPENQVQRVSVVELGMAAVIVISAMCILVLFWIEHKTRQIKEKELVLN